MNATLFNHLPVHSTVYTFLHQQYPCTYVHFQNPHQTRQSSLPVTQLATLFLYIPHRLRLQLADTVLLLLLLILLCDNWSLTFCVGYNHFIVFWTC